MFGREIKVLIKVFVVWPWSVVIGAVLLPSPPLPPPRSSAPMTAHLEAAPSKDQPAHCSGCQPWTERGNASNLWLQNSSERHVAIFFFLPCSQALLSTFYALSQHLPLTFPFSPLCSCLIYVLGDKRRPSSPPFNLFIFVSFPLSSLFAVEKDHWDRNHK